MKYYKVVSSHWPGELEFKSDLDFKVGQCFRITKHDGFRNYPTRFKVIGIYDEAQYTGSNIITILEADTEVEAF